MTTPESRRGNARPQTRSVRKMFEDQLTDLHEQIMELHRKKTAAGIETLANRDG